MSALKSASAIFGSLDAEPKEKLLYTLAAARRFEQYITDGVPNEPVERTETQEPPLQDPEDDLDL